MARILFLSHRIPYPPNKGDKIRSWHFLEHLCKNHEVHAGFFIDDKDDFEHLEFLESKCETVLYAFATPSAQKLASLRGLITGGSLTENAYPSPNFRRQLRSLLEKHAFDLIFLYSAATYSFLPDDIEKIPIITDFVDVDSEKWRAYGDNSKWPMSWVFAREAETLSRFEAKVANKSACSILVSDDEARLMRGRLQERNIEAFVQGIPNGVDISAFAPENYDTPAAGHRIIFTGAMDYAPNVEAVVWFAENVFEKLKQEIAGIEFLIAGRPVASAVQRLGRRDGIVVLGAVDDMAAEIAKADIVIAPLQTARGIQNKVLEGMAMAKPVVCTRAANEGINAEHGITALLSETPDEFVQAIRSLLDSAPMRQSIGGAARNFVDQKFSWKAAFSSIDTVVGQVAGSPKERQVKL